MLLLLLASLNADIAPCVPPLSPNHVVIDWRGEDSGCSPSRPHPCQYGEVITFTARPFNYSFDCAPHSFLWELGDGTTSTMRTAQHRYAQAASYNVTLKIANFRELVTLQETLHVPIVDRWPFIYERLRHARAFRFTIIGAVGEGEWVWDFGDGTVVTSSEREQTHVYATSGTFSFRLSSVGRPDLVYESQVFVPHPRRRSSRH